MSTVLEKEEKKEKEQKEVKKVEPKSDTKSLKALLEDEGLYKAVTSGTCTVLVGGQRESDLGRAIGPSDIVAVVPVVKGGN